MSEYSKLQIRAKALSAISELQCSQALPVAELNQLLSELKDISDKKTLASILIKEMLKYEEPFSVLLCSLIIEVTDKDSVTDCVSKILTSSKYSDELKYKAVQLLRGVKTDISYENIIDNFDNPQEVLDADTEKMLKKALVNPEAQIDFLDFMSALPDNDKNILLSSFCEDYDNNNLANILATLVYSDFKRDILYSAVGLLGDSKSDFAVQPLEYLSENSDDNEIVVLCKKGLVKLKLAGATKEKALIQYKQNLSCSAPDKCYTTIPDGQGNQGMIFTRIKPTGNFIMATFVINDTTGAIDAFGFYDVSPEEKTRIVERFNRNETKIIVSPNYVKTLYDKAINKNIELKHKIPYEFLCWGSQLRDVEPLHFDIVQALKNKISETSTTNNEICDNNIIKKWFITTEDNEVFKELCKKCFNDRNLTFEFLVAEFKNAIQGIFDSIQNTIWQNRILNSAYLLLINGRLSDAKQIYSLCNDKQTFEQFKRYILKKSIISHIHNLILKEKEMKETTNIFRQKQQTTMELSVEQLEQLEEQMKDF